MRFLVDRCAGRKLAEWLREHGHDVLEVRSFAQDPGDAALIRMAAAEQRILVTIDTDFGALIHTQGAEHAGLIRLPDVPTQSRIALMTQILRDHPEGELSRAVVTVKGSRIRISRRTPTVGSTGPDRKRR